MQHSAGAVAHPIDWTQVLARIAADAVADETTGCWVWQTWHNRAGYGRLNLAGETWYAHRAALRAATGRLGECALHSCDNPPCVNPAHLRWGSHEENMADAVARSRMAAGDDHYSRVDPSRVLRGAKNGSARIGEQEAKDIRALYATSKISQRELGRRYGISQTEVGRIVRGARWAHQSVDLGATRCTRCGSSKEGMRANQPWCRSCRDALHLEAARLSRTQGPGYAVSLAAKYGVTRVTVLNWAKRGRQQLRTAS